MPHRDPETGKFVSHRGSEICWEKTDTFAASQTWRIDAADLGGGRSVNRFESADTLVDFGDLISDEFDVAEVLGMYFRLVLSLPTTATAESFGRILTQVRSEASLADHVTGALQGADTTENTIDVQTDAEFSNETYWQGVAHADASVADTTNTLGAGAEHGEMTQQIEYRTAYGGGPVFDDDDELFAPAVLETDNISDHRILGELSILGVVKEWERDECPVLGR